MNRTDEGTTDGPSSADEEPANRAGVDTGQCNRSPAASARAIGGQSQIVRAQLNTRQCRQKIPATMAPNASHTSKEPPCSRADGKVRPQATGNDATK